jgi:hypothetical protein
MSESDRLSELEARVEALSATLKTVMTTLVLRGVFTKPQVDEILREAGELVGQKAAAMGEMESVRADMPKIIRSAMGPHVDDDDDHGH